MNVLILLAIAMLALLLATTVDTTEAFSVVDNRPVIHKRSASASGATPAAAAPAARRVSSSCLYVTKKQKEQLDKYGSTPETSIEILFDKMTETPDFVLNVLPKPWKKLVKDMKQMKQEQQEKDKQDKDDDKALLLKEDSKVESSVTATDEDNDDSDTTTSDTDNPNCKPTTSLTP
mmetsp:Transcript_51607/g.124586  ORF Transcript_51607/g.124586 Transcript_51607/m.124586 type:complete len:176 (+) Transcript_51607:153-680(+)|eukprot:CAMPEP_0113500840 /NCGR_PEP_ID=MMETSP0014_2-20120614/32583_1 /TAXON_ID=2857 /ORGANISM="Nitzschia sp." /LENGTH=175 /DNA_ID=CAMNT_0000395283 /DNA_START=62 /DNA_END=589 /DNA_ORIENTATION=+ /assembly_acc=CAM_ASM_000159